MAAFDFTDPVMDAHRYVEAVADEQGEEAVEPYFTTLVDELFTLEPALRAHFADALLNELSAEISRDDTEFAWACRAAIAEVRARWEQEGR